MTVTTNATGAAGLDAYGLYAKAAGRSTGRERRASPSPPTEPTRTGSMPRGRPRPRRRRSPSGASPSIATNGATAAGVQADGGHVTLSGGTVTTIGRNLAGVRCERGELASRPSTARACSPSKRPATARSDFTPWAAASSSAPGRSRSRLGIDHLDRPQRLRRQRRRLGLGNQSGRHDDHDDRPGRGRTLRQRPRGDRATAATSRSREH